MLPIRFRNPLKAICASGAATLFFLASLQSHGAEQAVTEQTQQGVDTREAVSYISRTFAPNPNVKFPETGKGLSQTGTWGVQSTFPEGVPLACRRARVPCVRVVYRIPESKLVCSWLVGQTMVLRTAADGSLTHEKEVVVLDEDTNAAQYTMQMHFSPGTTPHKVSGSQAFYPAIAQAAHVEGIVGVRVLVGADGRVQGIVGSSGPRMLQESALSAVRDWTFEPALVGTQTVSFVRDVYINYQVGHAPLESYHGGSTLIPNSNPHINDGMGFVSQGATGNSWTACTAVGCGAVAPPTPR